MLSECRQTPKETILNFGESVFRLVKKIFPNVSGSEDIDKVMQERFTEGLFNQRLRKTVRSKMLKIRNKTKETFHIQDLIDYAECKNASYDSSHSDSKQTSCDKDHFRQPKANDQKRQNNFVSNSYSKQPNGAYNQLNPSVANSSYNQPPVSSTQQQQTRQNQVMSIQKNKKIETNEPIKGQALFNNTLVNYMCDSGADLSIIDERTYRLIKRHAPDTMLKEEKGIKLKSVSGDIRVIGSVVLKRCVISSTVQLRNVKLIVTDNFLCHKCLLGRDIITKIPVLREKFYSIHGVVKQFSSDIVSIFKREMSQKRMVQNGGYNKKQKSNFHCVDTNFFDK
ncbi:unnamed protein product [Brachionus calyciflorus]|uniref:Peptidase A2 domain-containing protein n=1 Tax=Brachionus calyciflorus TaxID=104777 RepID=A0A813ZTC9_9BILA|nr:unnamed protein product [Brachionus calyciflorus]